MSQGVFERRERRTRSCWPVIRQLIFNAALPHSGQRRSVTEHQLLCCGEVKTTSHIPRTKIVQMEIPLEKFFQIFSHGRLAAFDGMANGALVHALLPGDLAIALAEDQMRFYPDALHLRQRVEGIPQVDEQFHTIQKLLRRRLVQAGRVFDPIVTVEGILRLVAGRATLIGCLIQLVRLQLGGHFVGNFDVFIMGVPSVKVLQIDGRHLYFLHSVHVWVGEQNGGTVGIGSRGWLLWDNLSQGAGI